MSGGSSVSSKPRTMRRYAGPFSLPNILYRIGFDWCEEWELVEGYYIGTAHLPSWAVTPGVGIVGTWKRIGRQLRWFFVPLTPWLR